MNLYPHQFEILEALRAGKRYIVAAPRTGKTRPVLEFLRERERVLILTPKNAISGWKAEMSRINLDERLDNSDWVVTNHEAMRSKPYKELSQVEWDAVVLDEAHVYGSYAKPNQLVVPVRNLKVKGPRLGVSATPCSETHAQLYHQVKALRLPLWEEYRNFYSWHKVYGIPHSIRAHGRLVPQYNKVKEQAWEEFKEFCSILDRKEAVPDFIEAEDQVVPIEAPEILEMCEQLKKDQVLNIGGRYIVADTPLALAQKCQQICAGVVLDDEGNPLVVNTVKRDWVQNTFSRAKIAVLTQFKAEVDQIGPIGGRKGSISEFQAGECDWLVGNVRALNAGVDLSMAEALVMTGCPWSFTQFSQARERLLRRDRTTSAPVYFPVIAGGIDEKVYRRVAVEKLDFHSRLYE